MDHSYWFPSKSNPEKQSIQMMVTKISAFLRNLFASLINDVPKDSARCEFIFDRLDCPPEVFEHCKKRRDYQVWDRDN